MNNKELKQKRLEEELSYLRLLAELDHHKDDISNEIRKLVIKKLQLQKKLINIDRDLKELLSIQKALYKNEVIPADLNPPVPVPLSIPLTPTPVPPTQFIMPESIIDFALVSEPVIIISVKPYKIRKTKPRYTGLEDLYYTYTLRDPRYQGYDAVRYVGHSKNIKHRFANHCIVAKRIPMRGTKEYWILELNKIGLKPILNVEDTTNNRDAALVSETKWDNFYRSNGCLLFSHPPVHFGYLKGRWE